MKFIVLLVVGCVAFAAANDIEPSTKEVEELKNYFEMAVEELKATCENHKTACNEYISNKFTYASEETLKNHFIGACVVLLEQYLCQGKKDGEGLVDLYKQAKNFDEQAKKHT